MDRASGEEATSGAIKTIIAMVLSSVFPVVVMMIVKVDGYEMWIRRIMMEEVGMKVEMRLKVENHALVIFVVESSSLSF